MPLVSLVYILKLSSSVPRKRKTVVGHRKGSGIDDKLACFGGKCAMLASASRVCECAAATVCVSLHSRLSSAADDLCMEEKKINK